MKDLSELSNFLGMEVKKTTSGVHLSQKKYVSNLIKKGLDARSQISSDTDDQSTILSKYSANAIDNP